MFLDIAEVINTKIFVIVDALDECSDWTAGFMDALNALPESGIDIRVLISSRPEDHIIDDLRKVPYKELEVKKETNHPDILAYVCSGLTSESVALQHGPDIGIENLAPKVTVSLGTETTELATHIAAEAEKDNPISNLPDFGSDEEEPPRYELAQWSRHLRAAEEAWPAAERDTDLQERWEKLYTIIEIILSPGSRVYRDRSRRLSLWRSLPFGPASRCS